MSKLFLLAILGLMGMATAAGAQPAPAAPQGQNPPTTKTVSMKMSEVQKIDLLIKLVEKSGLHFIRNGTEYDSKKAAAHLREKFDYAHKRPRYASQVATARDFIKNIATKSYLSGKPYQIKLKDGKLVPSGEWLIRRLEELEKNGPAVSPPAPKGAATTQDVAKKSGQ
jgi:hypothetical protein